jgi:NADPH2:quinone reductase
MQAIVVDAWGATPQVREVAEPEVMPGEYLVRIKAAAVGHLDIDVASGSFPVLPTLPFIPGVEAAGVVEQAPADAAFPPGSPVVVRGAGLGVVRNGGWADLVSAPAAALAELPAGMSFPVAASYFVPATTAAIALAQVAVRPQARILITGAGGAVGALAVQLAVRAGHRVIASTRSPERLGNFGDSVLVVPAGEESQQALNDGPGLDGLDGVIDTVGGSGMGSRINLVRSGGRYALVGYAAGIQTQLNLPAWLVANVQLIPINGIAHEELARQLAPGLAADLIAGALVLPVEVNSFGAIAQVMQDVRGGVVGGRAVIVP